MSTARDRGASSPQLLRRANRQALLQHALTTGSFTAADAMAATGLTRATVLGVCAELEQAGWLHEVSEHLEDGAVRRGRPARHYSLHAESAVMIGVDAGQHTLTARAVDLRGEELASASRTIEGELDGRDVAQGAAAAEDRVETVRALVDQVIEQTGAAGRRRLLTVVGVPAPVDSVGRSPAVDSTYWHAMNPGLVDALDGAVLVENDANLAVLAEHALAAPEESTDHVVALLMGERFGAGLIVDGRLLRGSGGGAGEMRFLDVVLGDSRGADGVAALARRWALEALAAGEDSPVLAALPADALSAVHVFAAARDGDPLAQQVLDRIAARLARITAILSSLLGVEKVVVAGAIADAIEPVLERSRLVLAEIATPPLPQLVASTLGRDVVARGAIELALARLRRDPLDLLTPEPPTPAEPPNEGKTAS